MHEQNVIIIITIVCSSSISSSNSSSSSRPILLYLLSLLLRNFSEDLSNQTYLEALPVQLRLNKPVSKLEKSKINMCDF